MKFIIKSSRKIFLDNVTLENLYVDESMAATKDSSSCTHTESSISDLQSPLVSVLNL